MVGGNPGTMVVRIVQNDQGSPLPPDLVDAAPSFPPRAEAGELVTLIDMDHFAEGNFDADPDWVVARAYEMHDQSSRSTIMWSPKTRLRSGNDDRLGQDPWSPD